MSDDGIIRPQSELDFNLWLTDTVWGSNWVSEELRQQLVKDYAVTDANGNVVTDDQGRPLLKRQSLWALMNYYTRDLRLSNLSGSELEYCIHFLDLAGDFLKEGFFKAFLISLSRVATVLELAQSKGGFLRKELRTSRISQSVSEEPPKKSLFRGGK